MRAPDQALRPRAALGVDYADGRITVIQATRGRDDAAFHVLADAAPALSPDVRRRLDEAGEPVAAALPAHEGFLRLLTAPFPSVAKARRVFPSLLDIQLPFPFEACACEFLSAARTADGQVTALAVAARREDVARALERLAAQGIDPALLDHEALALWDRSVREAPLARDAWRVVFHLGHDRACFVLGRGAVPRAASGVRLGVRDLVDPARGDEALRHLLQRVQPWLRSQAPTDALPATQWAWTGPGAARDELVARLREGLALSTETPTFVHQEPSTFLARAVAARAVTGGPLACNLRGGEQEHPRLRLDRERQARRWVHGALAASLLVCAVNLAWLFYLQGTRNRLQDELQSVAGALAGSERLPRGQEVLAAERALQERATLVEPFRQVFLPSLTEAVAPLLRTASRHEMTLATIAVRPRALVCSGTAADWSHCEAIQAGLASAGWQAELERREAGADERVHFTVKAAR